MSVRLYVKLPKAEIEKEGFEKMFMDFEPTFTSKLIKERKKGECRGFGFITVPTDEAADEFISKYNDQTFFYNGEPFKDEGGNEFKLLIEKALPRAKGEGVEKPEKPEKPEKLEKPEKKEKKEVESHAEETKIDAPNTSNKLPRTASKRKKNRQNNGVAKAIPANESIQPDPRWAADLQKLKEMFAAQTTNS